MAMMNAVVNVVFPVPIGAVTTFKRGGTVFLAIPRRTSRSSWWLVAPVIENDGNF
jgi:hypothetical protein